MEIAAKQSRRRTGFLDVFNLGAPVGSERSPYDAQFNALIRRGKSGSRGGVRKRSVVITVAQQNRVRFAAVGATAPGQSLLVKRVLTATALRRRLFDAKVRARFASGWRARF